MARQVVNLDPQIHCISLNSQELDNDLPKSRRDCYLVEIFSTQNSEIVKSKLRSKVNTELARYDPYRQFSIRLGKGSVIKHKKLVMETLGEQVCLGDLQHYASKVTKGKTQWVWARKDRVRYWKKKQKEKWDVIEVLKDITKRIKRKSW